MELLDSGSQQKKSSRKEDLDVTATKTLQDVPLEILDMILMKTMLSPLKACKCSHRETIAVERIQQPIELLMAVWSEWYIRINTRWFKIMYRRLSRIQIPRVWKMISLDQKERVVAGFTKLRNSLYVLCDSPPSIYIYEDHGDYHLINTISLAVTRPIRAVLEIHSSIETDCLYVSLLEESVADNCFLRTIWTMEPDGNSAAMLMEDFDDYFIFSVMEDHNIMMAKNSSFKREDYREARIEIYQSNAAFIRGFNLPHGSLEMRLIGAVHTQQGNFIVSLEDIKRRCYSEWRIERIIHLDKNGQIINELDRGVPMPSMPLTEYLFNNSIHICMDNCNNRLFATNYSHSILFVFDSESLKWIETIRLHVKSPPLRNVDREFPMYFDSEKRQLIVRNYNNNHVEVYKML